MAGDNDSKGFDDSNHSADMKARLKVRKLVRDIERKEHAAQMLREQAQKKEEYLLAQEKKEKAGELAGIQAGGKKARKKLALKSLRREIPQTLRSTGRPLYHGSFC